MPANRKGGKSSFFTRSGSNWLGKFSFINEGLAKLPPDIIIDGEVVSVEPNRRWVPGTSTARCGWPSNSRQGLAPKTPGAKSPVPQKSRAFSCLSQKENDYES